jgi:hypothetical protein
MPSHALWQRGVAGAQSGKAVELGATATAQQKLQELQCADCAQCGSAVRRREASKTHAVVIHGEPQALVISAGPQLEECHTGDRYGD